MKRTALVLVFGCLFLFSGCSLFGGGDATDDTVARAEAEKNAQAQESVASEPAAEEEAAPAGNGSVPARVQQQLDSTARDLAGMASRTVVPNRKNPRITRVGKEYVATYMDVDMGSIRTTVRPGQSSRSPYVGIIEYIENEYQCTGATRAEARKYSNCRATNTRNVKELISYDGKKWQY